MKVIFDKSYLDSLDDVRDKNIIKRADNAVDKFEAANSLHDISNIKPMVGYPGLYRHRFGDYRIGFSLETDGSIILLKFGHKHEFYKYFPKNYA